MIRPVANTAAQPAAPALALFSAPSPAQTAFSAPSAAQTAGQRYKSVRVLADIPASQIIEVMSVIAGSLGVTCAHCHETDFASDAKPMKERAREMIRMTRATDATFGGGKITCNTCHQGAAIPPATPAIEQAAWLRSPAAPGRESPLPSPDAVLQRYVTAVGGAAALEKMAARTVTGLVVRDNGRTGRIGGTFTLTQGLPDQSKLDTEFSFPPEARAELLVEFFRPRRAAEMVKQAQTVGRGVIRGRPTVMLEIGSGDRRYRLHFNEDDGLLAARESEKSTPLGVLRERHELSDYRAVNGVLQPFQIDWMRFDYHVSFTIGQIK